MKFHYKLVEKSKRRQNNKGQILVEYLLLMVIAIGCATLLTKALVDRSDSKPGMLIKAWDGILKNISNDLPDCENQTAYTNPNCPRT